MGTFSDKMFQWGHWKMLLQSIHYQREYKYYKVFTLNGNMLLQSFYYQWEYVSTTFSMSTVKCYFKAFTTGGTCSYKVFATNGNIFPQSILPMQTCSYKVLTAAVSKLFSANGNI